MCGICGSTRARGEESLFAMNAAMRHRGPDDEGVHFDAHARVAIGARRLSVVDLAGGHQPLSNETGRVWAALNGEIYNHAGLRESLTRMGHRFASAGDTEVLVHLYEEYGADLVHALDGMYAFAVWDSERGVLLLARDRFGEKPLYYCTQGGGELLFASELDALRAGARGCDELSAAAVDAFFVHGYVPGPGTILRDVEQLPPAHSLLWSRERGSVVARYWRPSSARHGVARELDELLGEAQHHLAGAVASRMAADVPVGVFLSGGVDSTLLAALAARHSHSPLKTFTVGYDTGAVNELDAARETAARLGAEHHELVVSSAEVAARVPAVLARLDHPLADQALVPLQAVAELARTSVTVALGGEGADELFGGYPRYRWLARARTVGRVVPPATASVGARWLATAPLGHRGARLADVLAPRPTIERHLDWVTSRRREQRAGLYGPRLSELAAGTGLCSAMVERVAPNGDLDTAALMRLDQLQWLPDDVLLKADRAGMLASLEVRAPYLSRELAEFAAGVAPEVHLAGAGKQLLRGVLRRVLPEQASQRRPKTAFRAPAAAWLRGPLVPAMAEQVRAGALYEEGWFAREPVRRLLGEHAIGAHDHSAALWPLLSLGLWLDRWRGVAGA